MKLSRINQIIIISISLIILVVALNFILENIGGGKKGPSGDKIEKLEPVFKTEVEGDEVTKISENETFSKIKEFNDYGLPQPSNLKKDNPFKEER